MGTTYLRISWTFGNEVTRADLAQVITLTWGIQIICISLFFLFGSPLDSEQHNVRTCPVKVGIEAMAILLMCEPLCHLIDVLLLVCGAIGGLGGVDVKALRAFSAESISESSRLYGLNASLSESLGC